MAKIHEIERLAREIADRIAGETGVHVEVAFHGHEFVEFSTSLRVDEESVNLDDEESARRMETVEYAAEELARAAGGQFDADTDCDLEVAREGGGRAYADYRCLVHVPRRGRARR
jgi:hypothetical protein